MEIARQVNQVREWIVEGLRPNVIRQKCSQEWG